MCEATPATAKMSVEYDFHCGPIARLAEDWFKARGIAGARFHSLDGHYVLRDEETGVLFDLEAVGGRSDVTLLPIYERTIEMGQLMKNGGYQKENSRPV